MQPVVAMAHPGRFLPDGSLARGTTPNLGTIPNQFDGAHPAQELSRRLHVPVIAENDAIAQMRFGLDLLLRDSAVRPHLLNQTVVYLGPGTGMGGGVAQVSAEGAVQAVTDGHLFDLQVVGYQDGTLTTEELFTGPAIARSVREANQSLTTPIDPARAGQLDIILASPQAAPEHRAVALRVAATYGEILARMIETIHAGRIVKVRLEMTPEGQCRRYVDEPDRAWTEADRRLVQGAKRFILGGFVGSSVALGAHISARALEVLRERGLGEVRIFQIPLGSADAGLLGVVSGIDIRQFNRQIN